MILFTDEIRKFIYENNSGRTAAQLTEMVNARFRKTLTVTQIKAFRKNHHLVSGLTGRFEPGHIPSNKGRKGFHAPGSEKGWFKKGGIPHNHVPVGTEVIATTGYLKVKVAEPDVWEFKHVLVWEKHNGKRKPGTKIIFLNGDRLDVRIENLKCISNAEHATMCKKSLYGSTAEVTEPSLQMVRVIQKIRKLEQENKKDGL